MIHKKLKFGFGYYKIEEKEYSVLNWRVKRLNENGQVILCLQRGYGQKAEVVEICRYNLDSSNYKKKVNLNFYQRKDMGAEKIIDKNSSTDYDFDIYTVGGDVSFTFDIDMVYEFKTALEEKVVTIEEILEQAQIDSKYGICQEGMYSDGETIEYQYENYIIIKYNTLDGNTDFVIAPQGQNMRNRVDDILYE